MKYKDLDYAVRVYLQICEEIINQEPDSEAKPDHGKKNWWKRMFDSRSYQRTDVRIPPIFTGKSDIKSAFRILGLSRNSWRWLVMKARDPLTGQWKFFVDKCLPFGASISCALFQKFSDALCFLIEFRVQMPNRITNYLDDFLFLARTLMKCNAMIQEFLALCEEVGVPIALEKTEWASDTIVFLGLLLDRRHLIIAIPLEKRDQVIQMLVHMTQDKGHCERAPETLRTAQLHWACDISRENVYKKDVC